MAIKLRPYQEEAVKKAIQCKNTLLAISTGAGKSLISIFTLRYLLNKQLTDKVIICCTKSSLSPFIKDTAKVKIVPTMVESISDLDSFLLDDSLKVALMKHSMISDIGFSLENTSVLKKAKKNITLIIDEVHEFSNVDSNLHQAYDLIRIYFDRVIGLTATPYSSSLEQIYGVVHLLYQDVWKDIKEFRKLFCEYKQVKDWKTGKYLYSDLIKYTNLGLLRKMLEPFTYFYFPTIKLNYHFHTAKLKDYSYYDSLAQGLLTPEDLVKEEKKK